MSDPRHVMTTVRDRSPALEGLRGAAMLLYFQLTFVLQFDPAKLDRITAGHPGRQAVIEALLALLEPARAWPEAMFTLSGFFLGASLARSGFPAYLSGRVRRLYPVWLAICLPLLSYTGEGFAGAARMLTLLGPPETGPPGAWALFPVLWLNVVWAGYASLPRKPPFWAGLALFAGLAVLTGLALGDIGRGLACLGLCVGLAGWRLRERLGSAGLGPPGLYLALALALAFARPHLPAPLFAPLFEAALALAVVRLYRQDGRVRPACFTARALSHPAFRFYGLTAYSFFLVQATWGFRLSRALLQSEIRSPGLMAGYYLLAFGLSSLFAAFLWYVFERPYTSRPAAASSSRPSQ